MESISKSALLGTHLFAALDDAQLGLIIQSARIMQLHDGDILFYQGDQANYFYLVMSGNIKLFRTAENGNEKVIEIVRPQHVFAEAVMFMKQPRYPVTAEAINDSRLYRFDNRAYLQLLSQSKDLCFALFGDLSTRLHDMLHEIDRLSLQNGRLRVCQYLSGLLQSTDQRKIRLDIEKKTIASMLSVTPETLSRIFRELSEEKIISIAGKHITVLDLKRLRGLTQN